jgi:hypothetical protein
MRRLSQIFVAIALLIPVVAYGYLSGSAVAYEREYGINPDGKGHFDVIVLALRAMWLFVVLAGTAALAALFSGKSATSRLHRLEVALICLSIPAAGLLARSIFGTWQATLHALLGV